MDLTYRNIIGTQRKEDMSDDEELGYDLVMPFLPVISVGGPYDDDAYVAGYEMGLLDAQLGRTEFDQGRALHGENREQADLIAMRHGYTGEFTNDSGDGWVRMKVHQTADLPVD